MNIEGMTDELKRIRIAEACGWKRAPEFDYVLASPIYRAGERMEMMCKDGDIRAMEELPDYLNDLNAMRAAAMCLRALYPLRYIHYTGAITQIVAKANSDEGAFAISSHDATARQRADAFLSTLPEPEQEAK